MKEKPKVYLRGDRWCIDVFRNPRSGVWAWHNTFEGAVYEAIQFYVRQYRDHDITGKRW